MNGYEVARRLRAEHAQAKMLLVALTGYQKDEERLRQAGFDRHLIKPPNMNELFGWLAAFDAADSTRPGSSQAPAVRPPETGKE